MSDTASGLPGLVLYYDFVREHLPLANGQPRGKRSAQALAQRYKFTLVRVGNLTFIDPEKTAERLRETRLKDQATRDAVRRPGRPSSKATHP